MSTSGKKSGRLGPRLGLYVSEERERSYGDYYHVRASVVTIGPNAYEMRCIDEGVATRSVDSDKIRNVRDELINGLFLNDLLVTSQGNSHDEPRKLYGFEVRYQNIHHVDLRDAERMAKTLRTIQARMDKLDQKFGHAASFGAYLARVAEAIGASAFVHAAGKSGGWSYDDQPQRVLEIQSGIYWVDSKVRDWVEEIARKEEARKREEREREAELAQYALDQVAEAAAEEVSE